MRELECVTSMLEWRACGETGEKDSLQLDLDPTSFTSYRQCMHRNVGNVDFQLMVLFQMQDITVLDVQAPERQAHQQHPHEWQC